ncbi:SPOC like C-terminal domain-containing protein [Neocallimastix lanati (nom. inval.)]|jgi:ATP-dependent DNA helicase 2 subunit 1|nr:SPOC like C-terminal domain-containing protein [Neocallimastix sp. JGI-2020a]
MNTNESLFDIDFIEENEENENENVRDFNNREALLFAIDCSPSMFQKEEDIYPFKFSLKATISFLEKYIIQNHSDFIGILFFSTDKNKNTHDYKNIYIFKNIDVPDSQTILDLEEIEKDNDLFSSSIGTNESVNFSEVLLTISQMFSENNKTVDSKKVLLFTNQDNPIPDSLSKENKTIFNIINDFSFLKILVEPFFLYNAEKPFDFDIFYKDFFETLYADNEEYLTMVSQDISKRLDQLVTKIHQKEVKKRSLFKIPFHISDDLTIGVEGFNIISEQKKSSYVWIDDQSGKVADLSTTWVCHDTTQPLFPSDFKYSYIYGGKLVVFTKDELFKIRNFGKPGLTLLGFKPLSKLKFQYNIKHPYFIYPDENQYIGSYSVFAHLLDTMAKMEKMAICNFIPRSNSSPRLVALLPQTEERDENDIQIIPPGFNVIPLPFADDIRTVKNNACERASEELDIEFGKIIKGINNKEGYNPRTINNPYLQKFYLNLQTIALNRDEIEDIKDDTIFQYEVSDKVNELIQSIGSQLSIRSETPKEVKRKNTDNSQSQRKKQCNEKTGIANVTSADSLKSYTVAELKEYLTSVNIKPTKKKADLIDQVVAYLKL